MTTSTDTPVTKALTARLVLHTGGADRPIGPTRRWLARCVTSLGFAAQAPLSLRIEDQDGISVLAVDDAAALIELPLPAGIYRITAQRGSWRRGYTMNLPQGGLFDLDLRDLADFR
ncbi:hypothetical protein [Nevskia ramosa]|uniref:hypothetical protein n=1 Tax=Nevskia ramosa TaxID=64002 RepID=UPI0003B2E991|nr:hypothetical protein [Nevskia ramosa]